MTLKIGGGSGGGGSGVPDGGTAGQVLLKLSATDGDADWSNAIGILDAKSYYPDTTAVYTPGATAGTQTDIDATNAAVTFTVPSTGVVYIRFEATVLLSAAQSGLFLNLREGSSDIARTKVRRLYFVGATSGQVGVTASWRIDGLTPASSHTYKVGFSKIGAGTAAAIYAGGETDAGLWGPMVTVVSASPLA